MKTRKKIAAGVLGILMTASIAVSGMTTYGYYGIKEVLKVGIRAWAYEGSGYSSASAKIIEGNYDSGWETGRDVTVTKKNNPLKVCYGYHTFNE